MNGEVLRINRNIVECKFVHFYNFFQHTLELIETLWNVNVAVRILAITSPSELIETLWNVNSKMKEKATSAIKN